MCLVIPREKESFITKEDMTVFKILRIRDGLLFAAYEDDFYYECDKLYSTTLEEVEDYMTFDYLDQREAESYFHSSIRLLPPTVYKSIGPGFHSALNQIRLAPLCYDHYVIRECIIPKGSECYLGFTDLIVSNQIIIKKHG